MTSKKNNFIFWFLLSIVSLVYLFFRFYHLPQLIGFRLDQSVHLLETKQMIDERQLRLVGPMVTSKSFDGRNFFIGANYYYVLALIGIISSWNPLIITGIFIIIELIFYLIFILFIKKTTNSFLALISFLFISLSPYLVIHSRFFWNPHLLTPLSILCLILLNSFSFKSKIKYLFFASFFWGFAFSCHYSAIFWGIFFLYFLIKSKNILNFKFYLLIALGFFLGDLSFFLFEFRHQFYNLSTMFYIFTYSSQGGELTSHYFIFSLLIFLLYFSLILFSKIKNHHLKIISPIILFSFLTLIQLNIFSSYQPLDSISGWNYSTQNQVADIISINCPKNFNIAATIQGDTRFYDLRYLLNLRNCNPNGVENYPNSETIFLVSPTDRSPQTETVWEISSFQPFEITAQIQLNSQVILYRLQKKLEF